MWQRPPYGHFKGQDRRPNLPQARFHASPATFKLFLGGVGSGKTHAGAREMFYSALDNGPGCMYLVGAPSHPILETATWEHYLRLTHEFARVNGRRIDKKIRISPQNRSITLAGDITFRFICLKNPNAFAGPTIAGFHVDEAALLENGMAGWNMLLERLRETRARRLFGIATTTPRGPVGIVQHFIEQTRAGNPEYEMVTATTHANVANLGEAYIRRQLAGKSKREVQQQLEAKVLDFQGSIYAGAFDNIGSLAGGWNSQRDLVGRDVYLAIDWGPNYPHVLWIAHDDEEDFDVVFGELCDDRVGHRELLERAMAYQKERWGLERNDVTRVYCDVNPASASRMARAFFARKRGLSQVPVHARVVNGTKDLLEGIDTVTTRLEDYSGTRRLLFAPELERTQSHRRILQCMRLYQWETRRGMGEEQYDDLRPNKRMGMDHGPDALRYYIWPRYRWQSVRSAQEAYQPAA